MRAVSVKRLSQLREYTHERKAVLDKRPICEVCKLKRAFEIHHMKGREGKLLLNKEFWLPVCWSCHNRIHSEPKWAREQGYRQ